MIDYLSRPEDTVKPDEVAELEARKQASMGQVLFKCARLLNEQALARVRARTNTELRAVHTTLFPHIDLEGTRATTLAARVGISKQAVGQLIDELEQMGAVERIPDPRDGRAKLVRFAKRGDRLSIVDGLEVLAEFEAEIAAQIGPDNVKSLHQHLFALLAVLERGSGPEPEVR